LGGWSGCCWAGAEADWLREFFPGVLLLKLLSGELVGA